MISCHPLLPLLPLFLWLPQRRWEQAFIRKEKLHLIQIASHLSSRDSREPLWSMTTKRGHSRVAPLWRCMLLVACTKVSAVGVMLDTLLECPCMPPLESLKFVILGVLPLSAKCGLSALPLRLAHCTCITALHVHVYNRRDRRTAACHH